MPGLLELGPMMAQVTVMGKPLVLAPLSTRTLIGLFAAYPTLVQMLDGVGGENMIEVAGLKAIAVMITFSTGDNGNADAVEVFESMGAGKQAEILDKVIEITFEDGVGPFVERIKKRTGDILILKGMTDSVTASSVPWSASLVGDEPRPPRSKRAHVN